jgi:hypothetical protein
MKSKIWNFIKKYWILFVLFIGVPIILVFGYFFYYSSMKFFNYSNRENLKHTLIKTSDQVSGIILSVYADRGDSFVTLTNSNKIWFEFSENDAYKKYLLCDFLQGYDSLIKHVNSDTLFIHRHRKIYYFILGRTIKKSKQDD